jgi:ABC-type transport system involved in multi-copper enzyme maturation permease subunit
MSASLTTTAVPRVAERTLRPSFPGMLRGELFKFTRQRSTWIMGILLAGLLAVPYLVYLAAPHLKDNLQSQPLDALFAAMERGFAVLRVFSGFFLLVLSALAIGLEYQQGTIRVVLARGVGRLQLLGAKVLALAIAALGVLVGGILINIVLLCATLLGVTGSLSALQTATPEFWHDAWIYLLTVAVSMGVTMLLAVTAAVVGRSLAFGLGVALVWFPMDNFGVVIMELAYRITNNSFWLNVTQFFLGPNLNAMPSLVVPGRVITVQGEQGVQTITQHATSVGLTPLVNVDGTHTLVVALVYALIFAAVAIVLTRWRDVLE